MFEGLVSLIEQMALHLSRAINVIVHISLRPATVPKPPKDRQPEKRYFFVSEKRKLCLGYPAIWRGFFK